MKPIKRVRLTERHLTVTRSKDGRHIFINEKKFQPLWQRLNGEWIYVRDPSIVFSEDDRIRIQTAVRNIKRLLGEEED